MSDLISKQAVLDIVLLDPGITSWQLEMINKLPSAQPERKKGRWIKISPANIYECSECGKNVMTDDISAYDFCHGCGAEMIDLVTNERFYCKYGELIDEVIL